MKQRYLQNIIESLVKPRLTGSKEPRRRGTPPDIDECDDRYEEGKEHPTVSIENEEVPRGDPGPNSEVVGDGWSPGQGQ